MSIIDDILSWAAPTPTSDIDLNRQGYGLNAGGQIIGALSHLQFGMQSQQASRYQADQLRINAGQAEAGSQRAAINADRATQVANSRVLAVAAASGGGASDPTIVNLMARNAGEGAYQRAVALYEGADKARLLNMQAEGHEYTGQTTLANSALVGMGQLTAARSTLIKGQAREASLMQRYGGDGPPSALRSRSSYGLVSGWED